MAGLLAALLAPLVLGGGVWHARNYFNGRYERWSVDQFGPGRFIEAHATACACGDIDQPDVDHGHARCSPREVS